MEIVDFYDIKFCFLAQNKNTLLTSTNKFIF